MTAIAAAVFCALCAIVSAHLGAAAEGRGATLLSLLAALLFAVTSGGLAYAGAVQFAQSLLQPLSLV